MTDAPVRRIEGQKNQVRVRVNFRERPHTEVAADVILAVPPDRPQPLLVCHCYCRCWACSVSFLVVLEAQLPVPLVNFVVSEH